MTYLNLKRESECEAAVNWLYDNKIIVNPSKFQLILLDKRGSDNTNMEVKIGNEKIKSSSSDKLLGVHIDDKLNFNHHNQRNALIRLKSFLGLKERAVLVNSFIYSNLTTALWYGCCHIKSHSTKLKVCINEL